MTRFGARAATSSRETSGYLSNESANTLPTPSTSSSDAPYVSLASDIHGRRHTATNASYHRGVRTVASHPSQSWAPNGAGTVTSSRAARARTSPPTSWTERGDMECTDSPASINSAASSQRFSSSFTTTRSGASATMAGTSGRLVPPTVGTPGNSQNRVHAIGTTPSATRVSLADGTNDTTRGAAPPGVLVVLTCARAAAPSSLRTRRA